MENEKRRLIDANALMEHLKEMHDFVMQDPEISPSIKWGEAVCNHRVTEAIEKAPTVDAVEVVHARWDDDGRCTRCGRYMPFDCEGDAYESIYCPDCGAVMTKR
jgi:hypothetical protein